MYYIQIGISKITYYIHANYIQIVATLKRIRFLRTKLKEMKLKAFFLILIWKIINMEVHDLTPDKVSYLKSSKLFYNVQLSVSYLWKSIAAITQVGLCFFVRFWSSSVHFNLKFFIFQISENIYWLLLLFDVFWRFLWPMSIPITLNTPIWPFYQICQFYIYGFSWMLSSLFNFLKQFIPLKSRTL